MKEIAVLVIFSVFDIGMVYINSPAEYLFKSLSFKNISSIYERQWI